MSNVKTNELRPMHQDILVRHVNKNRMTRGSIILKETEEADPTQYVEVLAVGRKVTQVKVGDIVLIARKNMTPPFVAEHPTDGEIRVAISDEGQVDAIVG